MARRVPIVHRRKDRSMTPQAEIAMYLRKDVGLEVDPEIIRKFILGRFTTLSILAHEIWEPHVPPGTPT